MINIKISKAMDINNKDKTTKKQMRELDPIMPVLKAMKVDETHAWAKKRRTIVRTTMYAVADQLGFSFITRTSEDKIYVTRVK